MRYIVLLLLVLPCWIGIHAQSNQLPIVLVHGANADGSIFVPLIPLLEAPEVANPSQRGRDGNQATANPANITFQDYVDDLISAVNVADLGNGVILVGHSFGGLLVSQVGQNLGPTRIRGIIYLSAYIPATGVVGDSFATHLAADTASSVPANSVYSQNNITVRITNASVTFLNDCPDSATTVAQGQTIQSIEEPTGPFITNVTYSNDSFGTIPKYFISTSLDLVVTPGFQQLQYNNLAIVNVTTIEAGHASMFCKPQLLADAINPIAARITASANVTSPFPSSPPSPTSTTEFSTSPSSVLFLSSAIITFAILMHM